MANDFQSMFSLAFSQSIQLFFSKIWDYGPMVQASSLVLAERSRIKDSVGGKEHSYNQLVEQEGYTVCEVSMC